MRIFLSVGHSILRGGGCTSASGYVNEYRYNKELAPYVKKELEVLGHQCDVIVCPENRFSNWKEERTYKLPIANSGRYDLVCELHLNASNGQGHGMECLYYGNDSKGRAIASRACSLFSKLGFKDRGPKSRSDLYILAQTKPTAVLFESFFCDNKGDCDLAHKIGFKNIASNIAAALVGSEVKVYNGWKKENNKWVFYKDNKKVCGWLKDKNKWYYIDPQSKIMHTGWLKYNNNWFYFNNNGSMRTGWLEYNNKWYYFNSNGYMHIGWLEYNGHKFYFDDDGSMISDCSLILNGMEYIFDSRGYMQ